jgi:hypothetical protein
MNELPDITKTDNWKIIKIPDLLNPEYKFQRRRNIIFAVVFSNVKVPIIIRAIEDIADWYKDEIYEKQTNIKEMEFYLKNYVKQDLAQYFRRKLGEENFRIQVKISSWRFIRIYLLYSMKNWLLFFFTNHWKKFVEEYVLNATCLITYEIDFVNYTYSDPGIEHPDFYELSPLSCLNK